MTYYRDVNANVRAALRAALKHQGLSQAELARRVGVPRQHISRALAGADPQGRVPPLWQKMLDALGLEITVQPKSEASEKGQI